MTTATATRPAAAQRPAGPQIKSRKPTGQVPYPLVLIEGPEGSGKSLIPVVLSRSPRVGMTYWIDLGEGAADEYAALKDSDYEVIEHDGSYRDILEQITAVFNEAARAHDAGEPPVVIVVDSMSALWTMLVNWTNDRARRSNNGKKKLAEDPDAEIDPTSNLWNDANKRHKRVMDLLMTFPGIAIVTARGKEVAVMKNGQPDGTKKEWKVEGQKNLAYDVTAWVRLSRDPRDAQLIKVRSLKVNVPKNRPMDMPLTQVGDWDVCDLDGFIFDVMGCTGAQARDLVHLRGDELEGVIDDVMTCPTLDDLKAIWDRVRPSLPVDSQQYGDFSAAVTARKTQLQAHEEGVAPADQPGDDGPTLNQHGPASDAEKLRLAAEAREAGAGEPDADADAAAQEELELERAGAR